MRWKKLTEFGNRSLRRNCSRADKIVPLNSSGAETLNHAKELDIPESIIANISRNFYEIR